MPSLLKNKTLSPKWYSVSYSKDKALLLTYNKKESCGIVGNCPFQAFLWFANKVVEVINMPHNNSLCIMIIT